MSLLTDIQTAVATVIAKVAILVTQTASLVSVITGPSGGTGSLVNVGPRTLKTLARTLAEIGASKAFTPRGVWDSATTYATLDAVFYVDQAYVSMVDGNLNNTPNTNPDDWMQLFTLAPGPISVVTFGADNTGVSDSTNAFRMAAAAMKASAEAVYGGAAGDWGGIVTTYIYMPPGKYLISDSIDLQDMHPVSSVNAQGWGVVGEAATILASMTGGTSKVVFDCIGSNGGKFKGFAMMGDPDNPPSIGVLLGRRTSPLPGGNFIDMDCFFGGSFSQAAIQNSGGESNRYKCEVHNQYNSADCYGIAIDGFYRLPRPSDFTPSSITDNTQDSCIQHTLDTCSVYMDHGSPYYFSDTQQVRTIGTNYMVSSGVPGIIWFQGGVTNVFIDQEFIINHEGSPTSWMEVRRATSGNIVFNRSVFSNDPSHSSTSLFSIGANVTGLTIQNSKVVSDSAAIGDVTFTNCNVNGKQLFPLEYTLTLTDDNASSFSIDGFDGLIKQIGLLVLGPSGGYSGLVQLRCNASPSAEVIAGGANFAVTTGVLSGTTGTDGKLTVSATEDHFYLENRTGSTAFISIKTFGSL